MFHCADLYTPGLRRLRVSTWVESRERCTNDQPLHLAGADDPLRKVLDWSRPTTWFGRMRDELLVEPIRYARRVVHWRNYEASHDVTELDARIHEDPSLELQEYVVDTVYALTFLDCVREILNRYRVPVVRLSIRHYGQCADSYLSLSSRDAFVFCLAVRSRPADALKADYAVWSRELVDAALAGGGSFNPAYHMHATAEQFARAFPRRQELLLAKQAYDPGNRFGNGLWSRYLDDTGRGESVAQSEVSEFRAALARTPSRDAVFRLLADCGPRGRAPRLMGLLERMSQRAGADELIYRNMRSTLLKWRSSAIAGLIMRTGDWHKPLHRRLALYTRAQLQAIRTAGPGRKSIDGIVEVASRGMQLRALRRHLKVGGTIRQVDNFGCQLTGNGAVWLESRVPARTSVGDILQWDEHVLDGVVEGADLITLYGGLSGLPAAQLPHCLSQLARAVRPGGLLLLLEHDADSAHAGLDASIAVTLGFLCAGETWEASLAHPRAFRAADEWCALMAEHGLPEAGSRERIARTPYGDTLLSFRKPAASE